MRVIGTFAGLIVVAVLACAWETRSIWSRVVADSDRFVGVGETKGPLAADDVEYQAVAPGVERHVLWGDPDAGEHGAFMRFAPGVDLGWHTHSSDSRVLVLKGAYLYEDEEGKRRVAPGCYLSVPRGKRHRSGGDPREGAIFLDTLPGKFDVVKEEGP
jgi:quercetin dioxygenase-like cupin family protein